MFTNLSDEFYYAGYGAQDYGSSTIVRNRGSIIVGTRNYGGGFYSGGNYYRGDRGSRPSGRVVPHRERESPPVFRGNNGRVTPNRDDNRGQVGRGRIESGSRSIQGALNYDHRSPVLDRQGRQETQRRELQNQARPNRSPAANRQSATGNREQPSRRSRGVVSETDRLNHYE